MRKRSNAIVGAILGLFLCLASISQGRADSTPANMSLTGAPVDDHPETRGSYRQLVYIQAGKYRPTSVMISNGSYDFNYSSASPDSLWVEMGWAARLWEGFASLYFEEGLAYTNFSGSTTADQKLTLHLLGIDTRLALAEEHFFWRPFIPFIEVGYQYTFYFQSGASDLDSAQGGVGNPVAGAGFRLWLNPASALDTNHVARLSSTPIFLSAKVSRMLPHSGGLNLAGTTYFGGVTFGL